MLFGKGKWIWVVCKHWRTGTGDLGARSCCVRAVVVRGCRGFAGCLAGGFALLCPFACIVVGRARLFGVRSGLFAVLIFFC